LGILGYFAEFSTFMMLRKLENCKSCGITQPRLLEGSADESIVVSGQLTYSAISSNVRDVHVC